MESLNQWFPGIKNVRSQNAHRVPSLIAHKWVDVTGQKDEHFRKYGQKADESWELNLLV